MERQLITGIAADKNEAKVTLTRVPTAPARWPASSAARRCQHQRRHDHPERRQGQGRDRRDLHRARADLARAPTCWKTQGEIGYNRMIADTKVAKISVVGVGMRSHAGVAATMFKPRIGRSRINIQAISTSEIKVSVLIDEDETELAVRVLHTAYGLDAEGDELGERAQSGLRDQQCRRLWRDRLRGDDPELLDAEIAATKALTTKPFGVNLITMHPQLFDLIAVCAKHGVSHVVLAGGMPPKGSVEAIKESGAKVICFAPALALAKKLLRSGVDALVIEGRKRAGISARWRHRCWRRKSCPNWRQVPVFVAGGIGGARRSPAISKWARRACSWARALPARPKHRAPGFQEGLLPRQCARCGGQRADRSAPAGDPGARAEEQGHRGIHRQAASRSRRSCSTRARSRWARRSLRSKHYWAGALRRAVIDGDVETAR
jgi:enoyl-[acyl-carrier protein] reductase II